MKLEINLDLDLVDSILNLIHHHDACFYTTNALSAPAALSLFIATVKNFGISDDCAKKTMSR